jgi:hypothetical protein
VAGCSIATNPASSPCLQLRGIFRAAGRVARRCALDEGEIVGCKFAQAGGDAPTLLDFVEEPLDQIACRLRELARSDSGLAKSSRLVLAQVEQETKCPRSSSVSFTTIAGSKVSLCPRLRKSRIGAEAARSARSGNYPAHCPSSRGERARPVGYS